MRACWSGGGGAPGPLNNLNAEIYYPPYLFKAGGQRAPRPSITLAPTVLAIGKTFSVDVANASGGVKRITLVKTGSNTHSWNMEQRFMDLTFAGSGPRVTVQAPTRAGHAPPGYYQLFVFDGAGVPSVSHILRVGIASVPNPSIVPKITNPGTQSTQTGVATSLQLQASDPNGDGLRYSATGLPTGLTLSRSTGLISGAPSTVGSFDVVATVSDGVNSASANFVWNVTAGGAALTLDAASAPSPVQIGSVASYTADASGADVRYRWNFGDGTPETAWSSSPTATHRFAKAGIYSVTAMVSDGRNLPQSRSFLQIVHLPPTANRPGVSSRIAFETPAGGNARLWVVDQDNDTVSTFDAVTHAKLSETSVGSAPRSVAVAPNGLVWVTNQESATISVIDPATRAVMHTIALPQGSMPFGIAMAPGTAQAFVALEAAGRLLKLDTTSYATLGSVDVGTHARNVSVNEKGSSVYVSRFITPPLPGEATVAPTPATGGEAVVVDAGSMRIMRTVVLRHSDQPNF